MRTRVAISPRVGGAVAAALLTGSLAFAQPAVAPLDRTVLPIAEPSYPLSTVLDARDAKAPPRFAGVGLDDATPVTTDYKERDNAFTGKILKVTVDVKPIGAAVKAEADAAQQQAEVQKALSN